MIHPLLMALKKAKFNNEVLMIEYVRMGEECYKNNDYTGRDYWNERYFQVSLDNELIEKDIRKLNEELKQS